MFHKVMKPEHTKFRIIKGLESSTFLFNLTVYSVEYNETQRKMIKVGILV